MERNSLISFTNYNKRKILNLNNDDKCKFMSVLQSINEVIWEINFLNHQLNLIGKWEELTGYKNNEIGKIEDLAKKIIFKDDLGKVIHEYNQFKRGNLEHLSISFRITTKAGAIKCVSINGNIVKDGNNIDECIVGTVTDITDIKSAEEKIIYMAYHDSLTNLPNIMYFTEQLQKSIDNKEQGAILYLDLDNFKDINENYGHNYGDVLLRIISELLKYSIKNYGMVARMGGDEFFLLLPQVNKKELINEICHSIMEDFKNPFEVNDIETNISVSIGIAIFTEENSDKNEILKNAEIAMNYAKLKGKNNYVFYNEKLKELYLRKKKIEFGLRRAISNNEFEIYYQPQINVNSNEIKGLEALLRWESPELGKVSPEEFIPIAEECGLICKIGEWVLKTACAQCKQWVEEGFYFHKVCVNISPFQLENKNFISIVNRTLTDSGLKPENLEIEITEGTLIKSIEKKSKMLNELISAGVKVAVDDFGKGYSSLNYLVSLPINTLKIDKSFIDNICKEKKAYSVVECIVNLSEKLNYDVVAEGVESEEQKIKIQKLGCTCIQGYYYSKPLPVNLIEKMLWKNKLTKEGILS